jgi:para-nitrobenzyl esterase
MWWALLLLGCDGGEVKIEDPTETDAVDTDVADTDVGPGETDVPVDSDPPEEPPASCPPATSPTLETSTGCVLGAVTPTGQAFLGVPYAEPPVGPLRWRPPVPKAAWEAPRDGSAFGPVCPQATGTLDGELGPGDGEEDCLTLNVWRPAGAQGLPILFFTHGGGHVDGAGSNRTYADDPAVARGAVLVTHNYRLGALGFLAHPSLSAEDADDVSGNYGLRDTVLALRWVKDNAAALGGDPDRILVFGESAGGLSSCALWLAPEARGLFSAVLTQSAPCSALERGLRGSTPLRESGEDQGLRMAEALGCADAPDVAACMRAVDVDTLLATLPGRQGLLDDGELYGIVVDGALLPRGYDEAVRLGEVAPVPLYAGANGDEGLIFTAGIPVPDLATYRLLLSPYALALRVSVDRLVDLYDPADYADPAEAFSDFYGDFSFVCPTRALLRDAATLGPARGYFFNRPYLGLGAAGAFHGAELGYTFGTLAPIAPAVDRDLSDLLQAAWISMATGAPAVDGFGAWPEIGVGWVEVRDDATVGVVDDVSAERCDVLTP